MFRIAGSVTNCPILLSAIVLRGHEKLEAEKRAGGEVEERRRSGVKKHLKLRSPRISPNAFKTVHDCGSDVGSPADRDFVEWIETV